MATLPPPLRLARGACNSLHCKNRVSAQLEHYQRMQIVSKVYK